MKKLFALFFTLTFATLSFAQSGKINGRVVAADGKAMEFVTVTLHRVKDTALVKGAITDATGNYEFDLLKNGQYLVVAQQVGLKKATSTPLSISDNTLTVNDLKLIEDGQTLKAVTITAQKPFIEQQIDKTVVNVENSIVSAGSTALEVLEKSPGVVVDNEGRIQLRGKDGVRIMVDGKPSQLSADQLTNLLRNMNANQILRIEIITNPSAKYDAAGNAGIINIVMKKNQLYGTNGQFSTTYGQGIYYKTFNSLSLNYRQGAWNVFGSYNYNNRMNFNDNSITRIFRADNGKGAVTDSFVQNAYSRNPRHGNSWRGGVDYNLSKKTTIGVLFNGSFGGINTNQTRGTENLTTIYRPDGSINSQLLTLSTPNDYWNEFSGNANLKHTFDSTGRELTVDLDYSKYNNGNDEAFRITNLNSSDAVRNQQNLTEAKFNIASAKFDYTQPLSKNKAKFDFGGKTSFVQSDNDIKFYNIVGGAKIIDKNITNDFLYKENINAAYVNWQQELPQGLSYQVGLRVENTNITGQQITIDTSFERHYTDFFPTAFVQKKWGKKDKNAIRLGYSRRIDRPNYENLNPFRHFLDQYTFQIGNPNLTPQYSNNVDLTYTFMGALSISVNYGKTTDVMNEVLKQDDDAKQTFITRENLATRQNYGVSVNIPAPIKKWWFLNVNSGYNVNHFEGRYLNSDLVLDVPQFSANVQNRFTLPKDVSAEISGFYISQIQQGLILSEPMYGVNLGVSKQLLDRRLTLRLNAQDIFFTQKFRGYQKYENLDIKIKGFGDSRQVRFTASYRFGNQKVQGERRRSGGASDEQNRIQKNG
ncbi:MAG: TonB-dependent receptor [Saprospiraceae bacterium]|nr:TonB-dependent receptor [Saprospiraceae bacterium]